MLHSRAVTPHQNIEINQNKWHGVLSYQCNCIDKLQQDVQCLHDKRAHLSAVCKSPIWYLYPCHLHLHTGKCIRYVCNDHDDTLLSGLRVSIL